MNAELVLYRASHQRDDALTIARNPFACPLGRTDVEAERALHKTLGSIAGGFLKAVNGARRGLSATDRQLLTIDYMIGVMEMALRPERLVYGRRR